MGLYILVPVSVVLVFVIGIIFWWSVRSGQFDDLEGPGFRMLVDDRDEAPAPSSEAVDPAGDQTDSAGNAEDVREDEAPTRLDPDQTPPRD